jgi:hypothetical protein
MLLTLRVTEERKRISSVATHRVPHIDIDQAVIHRDPPIADHLMTTPHAAAKLGLLTEESSA